jgi:hypothetical protein
VAGTSAKDRYGEIAMKINLAKQLADEIPDDIMATTPEGIPPKAA